MSHDGESLQRGAVPPAPLHPVDFAPARRFYYQAMALQLIASPMIFTAATLYLLAVSSNLFTPFIGPVIGLTLTCYVERGYRAGAWAHIARRVQDVGRSDPTPWAQLGLLAQWVILVLATAFFVDQANQDLHPGAQMLGVGLLSGLVLVEVSTLVWDRHAEPGQRSSGAEPWWKGAQVVAVTVVALSIVTRLLSIEAFIPWAVALGALAVLGISVCWYLLRLIPTKAPCVPKSFPMP